MAANPFDQFDEQQPTQASGNPFDQFDATVAAAPPQEPVAEAPSAPAKPPGLLDRTAQLASIGNPGIAALAEMAAHFGSGAFATPLAGLAGAAGTMLPGPQGQGANVVENVQGGMTYQPRTPGGQALQTVGGFLPGLIAKGGDAAGQVAADATGSPAAGAAVNTAAQLAPALLLRGRAGKIAENVDRPATPAAGPARPAAPTQKAAAPAERPTGLAGVSKDAPSIEQLRTEKNAAYKRSEEAGVQISEFSFKKLKGKILNELGERVDPTLHPDTTAALKRVMDTKGALSLEKLDQLRQIANDAKGSIKPADQRLAARVVDSIDEFVDGISAKDITRGDPAGAAALKEARALNTRLKKGEQIQELFDRAEIKAGANYSQSGLENALRAEFKSLALKQKQMRRFTPEERAAIIKVAKGGKLENAMRFLGKFAPTGVVSATLSGGLGAMVMGPGGVAIPMAGLVGRAAATRMTLRNAQRASETVRRGRNALAEEASRTQTQNAFLEN